MKEWVLKIILSVFTLSSLSIILPEGKLTGYVKYVFSILLIPLIVEPILIVKNTEFDYSSVFNETQIEVQSDYLEYVSSLKVQEYDKLLSGCVENLGVSNAKINILYNVDENYKIHIKKVRVDLKNSVINSDKEHIDIIETIKTTVAEYLKIDKDGVVVYE